MFFFLALIADLRCSYSRRLSILVRDQSTSPRLRMVPSSHFLLPPSIVLSKPTLPFTEARLRYAHEPIDRELRSEPNRVQLLSELNLQVRVEAVEFPKHFRLQQTIISPCYCLPLRRVGAICIPCNSNNNSSSSNIIRRETIRRFQVYFRVVWDLEESHCRVHRIIRR